MYLHSQSHIYISKLNYILKNKSFLSKSMQFFQVLSLTSLEFLPGKNIEDRPAISRLRVSHGLYFGHLLLSLNTFLGFLQRLRLHDSSHNDYLFLSSYTKNILPSDLILLLRFS